MKKVMIVVLGLLLGSNAIAEEKDANSEAAATTKASSTGFFESLRQKIELLTPKKKLKTTQSVGGVRGSMADAGELYWKGETSEQAIDADELAALDEALSYAEAGDMAIAEKGLAAFINSYPKSQLRADAEQALALVRKRPDAAK